MGSKVFKVLLVLSVLWVIIAVGGIFLYAYIISYPAFTDEQCEVVKQNFDKLKVGMTKEEVLPLIGGERNSSITYPPGEFPSWEKPGKYEPNQKNPWLLWVLCHNPKNRYEWLMIAFDTKTNRVARIFSARPEIYNLR